MERPRTKLPTKEIKENDGWSDDSKSPNYNRPIKLPTTESHEKLFRDDEVYDIVIPLGYNDEPPVPGLGSAIFMHVARPTYSPTEGCIALSKEDLLKVLETCDSETTIRVKPLVALVPPAQA
jgi:L,D-peptidoglycan transpeptidase YkuD (ErfK/YbiS/YcfS/YnhG family)